MIVKIGSFVRSKKGRDKENIYIVKRIFDKKLELVDGNGNTLEKPKIKNIKHIEVLEGEADKIAIKLDQNAKVFDEEVYSVIKKYKNQ